MRRLLLSILCLVMAFAIYGEDNGRKLNQNKENYLVKKGNVWFDFYSNISIYEGSEVLERKCCQLLGIDEQQSLQGFVDERLKTNDLKTSFSQDKLKQLLRGGFVGCDYIIVRPKGNPVGDCHTYEVIRIYQDKGMEKKSLQQWTIVYDQMNDKVLTVDDVFVPEVAIELKNKAGTDFINLLVKGTMVSYGATYTDDNINYKTIDYIRNADKFTEQFKQVVPFDILMAAYQKAEKEEQRQAKLQKEADSLREERLAQAESQRKKRFAEEESQRKEHLARTAYKRVFNDFGELVLSESILPHHFISWGMETIGTSKTGITADKFGLRTFENADGTPDSLWFSSSLLKTFMERYTEKTWPGVSQRLSGGNDLVRSLQNSSGYIVDIDRWSTLFDIDIPDNPSFEQCLCKLMFNKSSNKIPEAGKQFSLKFKGKKIYGESADVITFKGRALCYNPGKYYSYAYSHTYATKKPKAATSYRNQPKQVGMPIAKNIIYDIENQKVLSLPDVLTLEEIAHLGLKKKAKADLALDNYNLYVGIDGKPICTYTLCRENWSKFAGVLQDLIGPYDNLPAKIDSTAFVCQDYEGIQPASISYKVVHEPSYGGHADSLLVYLKSHLALPDTMKSEHSWELQFVVGKDGRLSSVGVSSNKKDDGEEAIASQLTEAFEQMPAWQPLDIAGLGTQKFVETYKIQFVPYTVPTYSAKTNEDDRIYEKAETVPEFPGGNRTYLEWLYEHIKYPPLCREQGIQGQVIVDFVVNKDGSISDVKTRRSPDPNLSEEAERVIKSMPKWKPATIGGKPVRIRMTAPVIFRLH